MRGGIAYGKQRKEMDHRLPMERCRVDIDSIACWMLAAVDEQQEATMPRDSCVFATVAMYRERDIWLGGEQRMQSLQQQQQDDDIYHWM